MRLGVAQRIPRAMQDRGWGRYRSTSVDRLAIGKKYRLESQPPVHFKAQATLFVIYCFFVRLKQQTTKLQSQYFSIQSAILQHILYELLRIPKSGQPRRPLSGKYALKPLKAP